MKNVWWILGGLSAVAAGLALWRMKQRPQYEEFAEEMEVAWLAPGS